MQVMSDSRSSPDSRSGQRGPDIEERSDAESVPDEANGEGEGDGESSLPLDQIFEILKNERRRLVLEYLKERDEAVSMSELSERIAAWENDKRVEELSSSERKRVYVGLYQCHLPKMDGMDIVEFNKPRGIIELGENAGLFDQYLDTEEGEDRPWHRYYAGISVGSAALLVLGLFVEASTVVPGAALSLVVVVAAFSACSLLHVRTVESEPEGEASGSGVATPTAN